MKYARNFIRQVILYGIIGGASAFLDFVLFMLLYAVLSMNEFFANTISVHTGIAMSFMLNRKYNFKKTDRLPFRAVSFYLTGLFGLALSHGMLWLGNTLSMYVVLAKFVSIVLVAAVQFTLNKSITFKK